MSEDELEIKEMEGSDHLPMIYKWETERRKREKRKEKRSKKKRKKYTAGEKKNAKGIGKK